jgi:S-adenosylmethionine:tRNA ribosyltransferase-isomerase
VLRKDTGEIHHARFAELPSWLRPGDLLVLNDTRVIPAKLSGRKPTGGPVHLLLYEPFVDTRKEASERDPFEGLPSSTWRCLVKTRGRVKDGSEVIFDKGIRGVLFHNGQGSWLIRFQEGVDLRVFLRQQGEVPLPPYIRRGPEDLDRQRYQTIYARRDGSVAAPTAGLHFTEDLLSRLEREGIRLCTVTLHVGIGTFLPVRVSEVEKHVMHPEYMEVGEEICRAWCETRQKGGRVIAVGTTTVRALETAVDEGGSLRPFRGFTELFIYPGYRFRAIDALITNFHLPRSTLLMLVTALAGMDRIKRAYEVAVRSGYRFYSYGDAMLIL